MNNKKEEIKKNLKRRIQNLYPNEEEVIRRINEEKNLVFYLGIDPTSTQMHIGHTIPLLLLKDLVGFGHKAILLVGGFTAQIGDPTDKEAARTKLSGKEVMLNAQTYSNQIKKIFRDEPIEIRNNNDWLSSLKLAEIMDLAGRMTVQQMIGRDMFQERLKRERPIFINEFLYPLLQGFDSVAMNVDGEVGGNDQIFNMLVGRDLEKEILKKDKIVLATYLLVDEANGKKMSKSEGEVIALEDSPSEIRRKVLALDDKVIKKVFELCTETEQERIDEFASEDPRSFKEKLADELIRLYHGGGAVDSAREGAVTQLSPDGLLMTTSVVGAVVPSNTQFKHLVDGGAVYVNGKRVDKWDVKVKDGDDVQIGKGKFLKIKNQ